VAKTHINGTDFRDMVVAGARNLSNHSAIVDKLNVFPVPDGDTGKNMTMTFNAGAGKIASSAETSIGALSKQLSRELLMGARGNSGVILSQLFRGFSTGLEGKDEASIADIAKALEQGVKTAYKAVMKPVEGTILTVARESAEAVSKAYADFATVDALYAFKIEAMQKSLDGTPDLLPVLKEAGVVDSGGQGLLYVFEGFLKALKGEVVEIDESIASETSSAGVDFESDEFGYCTEFIFKIDESRIPFKEHVFRGRLEELGDSIVVVQDEDIVKVHVHTLKPGDALNLAQRHGEFLTLKIENMTEQHNEMIAQDGQVNTPQKKQEYAVIAVSAGSGINDLLKESGATYIIEGGQTMNPSTEDFLNAIEEVNAKNVIILPNNSNIIMAANQAKQVSDDVNVVVIPTKTIPQGYAAISMFVEGNTLAKNEEEMTTIIADIKSGSVTYAVRDTNMNGVDIKKGDFIGIFGSDIVTSTEDMSKTTLELFEKMIDEDSELVTIIYGEGATEDSAEEIAEALEEKFGDIEVEIIFGEQPVYSYIIAVE